MLAAGPREETASTWLILLAPLVLVGALVALAMYVRGGPPTAHGYAISATPRRRRVVPSWLITLLRPFFAYNEHRRAYVLRGVGNRLGPVLRRRPDPGESLPEPRRTGRFQRVEPALEQPGPEEPPGEPVVAAFAPRAPVGARGRPQAPGPSERPAVADRAQSTSPAPAKDPGKSKPPAGKRSKKSSRKEPSGRKKPKDARRDR